MRKLAPEERTKFVAAGGLEKLRLDAETSERHAEHMQRLADSVQDDPLDVGLPYGISRDQMAGSFLSARRQAGIFTQIARKKRQLVAKVDKTPSGNFIATIIPVWERHAPRPPHYVHRFKLHAQRFIGVVGDVAPQAVTQKHVEKFRDWLEQQPYARGTAAKHLETLHQLFSVARSEGLTSGPNPAAGIKLRKVATKFADEERKLPFTPELVRIMFDALPRVEPATIREDFTWIVRLLAYHGMRGTEAAQLQQEDVTVLHGVPVLRITDAHGSLKNRFSKRDVPLHPKCADFVAYAKRKSGPWIFDTLPLWGDRRGAGFQRLATDFLRKTCKITDKRLTMHSLRHLWTDLARNIEMPDVYARAILGHALGKGHHGGYGQGPSIGRLADWMGRIDPALDL